jgi:hypothetical protein
LSLACASGCRGPDDPRLHAVAASTCSWQQEVREPGDTPHVVVRCAKRLITGKCFARIGTVYQWKEYFYFSIACAYVVFLNPSKYLRTQIYIRLLLIYIYRNYLQENINLGSNERIIF